MHSGTKPVIQSNYLVGFSGSPRGGELQGGTVQPKRTQVGYSRISVPDPRHFCVDPDPRIHASDSWIRIRILLFSPLTILTIWIRIRIHIS